MSLVERIAQLSTEMGVPNPVKGNRDEVGQEIALIRQQMRGRAVLLEKLRGTGIVGMLEEITGYIEPITEQEISGTIQALTTQQVENYGVTYSDGGWRIDRIQLLLGESAENMDNPKGDLFVSVIEQNPDNPIIVRQVLVFYSKDEVITISGTEGKIFQGLVPRNENERTEVMETALAKAFIKPREVAWGSKRYFTT